MKSLDIKTASKVFKVSRTTVYAKIKAGDLSQRSDKLIDFVEMVRVFGEPSSRMSKQEKASNLSEIVHMVQHDNVLNNEQIEQNERLKRRITELEADVLDKRELIEWFKSEQSKMTEAQSRMVDTIKLLNAPVVEPVIEKGFWKRLFGG